MTSSTKLASSAPADRAATEQSETTEARPTLDSVVRAICVDAKLDSLKFVLRSDTGHDGE